MYKCGEKFSNRFSLKDARIATEKIESRPIDFLIRAMTVAENKVNYLSQPISIAFALATLKILLYIIAGANYGYFRDELYLLACADHIALGVSGSCTAEHLY